MLLDGPPRYVEAASGEKSDNNVAKVTGRRIPKETSDGFKPSFSIEYRVGQAMLDITIEVRNSGDTKWEAGGEAMACLSPVRNEEFKDPDGERTFVRYDGGFKAVRKLSELAKPPMKPGVTRSYRVKGEETHAYQAQRHSQTLDDGVIIRLSRDGKRLVMFAWDRVHRVSGNFGYSCIHSNPRVTGLKREEIEVRRGKIYFSECGLDEAWNRCGKDFAR